MNLFGKALYDSGKMRNGIQKGEYIYRKNRSPADIKGGSLGRNTDGYLSRSEGSYLTGNPGSYLSGKRGFEKSDAVLKRKPEKSLAKENRKIEKALAKENKKTEKAIVKESKKSEKALIIKNRHEVYKIPLNGYLKIGLVTFGITAAVAYSFYKSIIAFFALVPLSVLIFIILKEDLYEKAEKDMKMQFADSLDRIRVNMKVGESFENAVFDTLKSLISNWGYNAPIVDAYKALVMKIRSNVPIEDAFMEMSEKYKISDIREFAESVSIAKRTSGDVTSIVKEVSLQIQEKAQIEEEIDVIISSKKFEQNIMSVMPIFIIIYVGFTSPGFLDNLYSGVSGRIMMTGALLVYAFGAFLGFKFSSIKVE